MIDGGPVVRLAGEPAQGTRHRVRFGVAEDGDEQVVVKVASIPGALEREQTALAWLNSALPGLSPRLVAYGLGSVGGDPVDCLVIERCPGSPPTTAAGWERMGAAFAELAKVGYPDRGLPIFGHREFTDGHVERLRELGPRLEPYVRFIPDWAQLSGGSPTTGLVLTHADPGPGNYLDDGSSGSLIDWEDAQVAPLGLDLGRLIFIALLGSGPAGYVARDHQARADAATSGYLRALQHHWAPNDRELRWWVSVAGIQFIHRRYQLGGRPAAWEQAADVLSSALASQPHPAAGPP